MDVDDLRNVQEQFKGCSHINGSIIINLENEQNLTNEDFEFLSCLESISGVLSFENLFLAEQIVIPNLRRIEGNGLNPSITASLRISNVTDGDVIFPNLTRITRGNAYFNVTNDMCGYLGINWSMILVNGELVDDSAASCVGKYTYAYNTTILIWFPALTNLVVNFDCF